MGTQIRTGQGPGGEILHFIPYLPGRLPSVTKRDLEQAWEAACQAALSGGPWRATHGFRFHNGDGAPFDLILNDGDAASWVAGIDDTAGLSTARGVSLCLRILALVELMGRSEWVRAWFSLGRHGLEFHPALLQAAALSPLTETGGFAETALRALLPEQNPGL